MQTQTCQGVRFGNKVFALLLAWVVCLTLFATSGSAVLAASPASTYVSTPNTDNWDMFSFQHSRFNANERILTTKTVPQLAFDWNVQVSQNNNCSNVAVENGIVYDAPDSPTGQGAILSAYNATTGKMLWSVTPKHLATCTSPAVADGVVYVSSSRVYAYNATTGALLWTVTQIDAQTSPTVVNGIVYIGSRRAKLYALNEKTGAILWTTSLGKSSTSFAPAVANGMVYIAAADHTLYAMNATTGAIVWTAMVGGTSASAPSVDNGMVYIGSTNHKVFAFNAMTGAMLWHFSTGNMVTSSPAVAYGIVYIASRDNFLYALHATTGAVIWQSNTGLVLDESPAVANNVVYLTFDAGIEALNAKTGRLLWIYCTACQAQGQLTTSPTIANGMVYIGTAFSYLVAFHIVAHMRRS